MLDDRSPRVSILSAVRDGLPHLDETIESIRGQSLHDWEWIVVDDGSTDGSRDRLRSWARREPRISLHEQPATGLVAALNTGLGCCRAPLVARMDADDVALPGRLSQQCAAFDHEAGLTAVDGRVELFGGRHNEGMHRYVTWVNDHDDHDSIARDLFVESPIVHPAVCFRRDDVLAIGGYRDGDFPEDYDLWLRLYARGGRFRKLGETVLRWRDRPDRLTRTDRRYRNAAFTDLKQRALWDLEGPALAAGGMVLWGAARSTRPWRQWLRRHGVQPELVVDTNPRRHGHTILGAPVLPVEEIALRPWIYLLVTVSSPDSRAEIRGRLAAWGLADPPGRRVRFV